MIFLNDKFSKSLLGMLYPIALSMLSTFLMISVDRIFLSKYDLEALNAASSAGNLYWMVTGMFVYMVATAGNFISEKFGAKDYKNLAKPAWQMVYFASFSIIIFLVGLQIIVKNLHSSDYLSAYQADFLSSNYFYAPLQILSAGLSSFFVGIGKPKILTISNIIANITNIILDYFLVFGVEGYLKPMGIKGAAMATLVGFAIQNIILFSAFLNRENRKKFNTGDYGFDFKIFINIIKRGLAAGLSLVMDLFGWSIFYIIINKTTKEKAFVASLVQTVFLFFLFFGEALEKSISSLCSRSIGQKNFSEIKNYYSSGIKVTLAFGISLFIAILLLHKWIISLFLNESIEISNKEMIYNAKIALILAPIYITAENMRFMMTGILVSIGKSRYVLYTVSFFIWFFVVAPTYLLIYKKDLNIVFAVLFFTIAAIGMFFSMKKEMLKSLSLRFLAK